MFITENDLTAKDRATLLMGDKILIWISGFSFLKPQELVLQESEQQNQERHYWEGRDRERTRGRFQEGVQYCNSGTACWINILT